MKKHFLFFIALSLFVGACSSDSDLDFLLSYDGVNVNGPLLDVGTHEAAVLFTSAETTEYKDKQLIEISWYMGPLAPASTEVRVYGPGTNNTPGTLLYSADVSSALRLQDWNKHTLAAPVAITGQDLWISVKLVHNISQQSIGCDAGPNVVNGDWLLSNNTWSPYTVRTGESINWNIRGVVSED